MSVRAPEPLGGRAAPDIWDVVVIGGGNAALVSALTARHHVQNVLVLERAPQWLRGGNSRHTRNVRCVHAAADAYNTGSYLFDELYGDLCAVGTGPSDEYLAQLTVKASESVPGWMSDHGISWQPPLTGTLHLGRTNRFFLGGGKAMMNRYYRTAGEMGITVAYEASAEEFIAEGDRVTSVVVDVGGRREQVRAKAIVCAAGGFEANIDWLARYWGEAARNYIIRGPIYNDGTMLQALYDLGAASAGEEKGFHSTAVDARSPRFDGGIATRLDSIPFGVVLNRFAKRFYDEGEELWPKRYAIWGRNIAEQDGQIAYAIWDSKVTGLFLPPMYGPIRADSLPELAGKLGLDEETFGATLSTYNAAVVPGAFDPTLLDDCRTFGLEVPKSHWAQRIDEPPYFGIVMRPGITFTYLGVKVDEDARVRRLDGSGFENVFAAGEIMSGNVLSSGYLAGFGLTIGTVWGRIAGSRAAELASSCEQPRRATRGRVMIDDLLVEGKRQLDICNSCRYCEGYCAVFPSLERRIDLGKADMVQLANLCHDCRECLYACMYAPPHEFGVNPPQLFSMLRREHADELSSFSSEIKRHERRPLLAGLLFVAGALAAVLVIAASTVGLSGLIATHHLAASPYSVLSYPAILAIGMASLALGVVLLAIEGHRFWRASGERARPSLSEIGRAIRSAAVLTNLGGGGEGCAYPSEEGSSLRRHADIAVAWGFTLCLVATIAAAVLQDFLGDEPPYGWISVPVLLGLVGGVGLVVGSLALSIDKLWVDPAATDSASVLREYGFLLALFLLGVGGLVALLTRTTPIYGIVLALHLATVFACFVLAPFTKFTHVLYRFLALVRDEHERAVERVAVGL